MAINNKRCLMSKSLSHVFFLFFFFAIITHTAADGAINDNTAKKPNLDDEVQKLQAAHQSWQQSDAEYRELSKGKKDLTDESEIREFAVFVAILQRRVFEGSEIVRKLGGDPDLPCVACSKRNKDRDANDILKPGSDPNQLCVICSKSRIEPDVTNTDVALSNVTRKLTREEKIAFDLARFNKIGFEFDNEMSKHNENGSGKLGSSQSNGNWAKASGDAPYTNNTESSSVMTDGAGKKNGPKSEPINGKNTSGKGTGKENQAIVSNPEREPGAGPGLDKGKIPDVKKEDIADSSDDDIVARQLREAAESETDPELKEQLWNEYKKYKKSAS